MNNMNNYEQHVVKALHNAESAISKINYEILNMEGMTGVYTRHFYNNLLDLENARYLEVGTWKGSSVCSAMYRNKATVVCIDNWSQFSGPKNEFLHNFEKFKGENNATFIESESFSVDVSCLPKFNIYMYDGDHSYESQYKALEYYLNCLDDVFIFVVDDWNWQSVRNGTKDAIKNLNLKILYEKEIRLTLDESHTPMDIARNTWWNGIYITILQK
jgi:hypothetical protein